MTFAFCAPPAPREPVPTACIDLSVLCPEIEADGFITLYATGWQRERKG